MSTTHGMVEGRSGAPWPIVACRCGWRGTVMRDFPEAGDQWHAHMLEVRREETEEADRESEGRS